MPRKKRDIRREYRQAGFDERQDKGDHTVFSHPLLSDNFSVDGREGADAKPYDGREGADAKPYDEKELQRAKRELAAAKRRRKP